MRFLDILTYNLNAQKEETLLHVAGGRDVAQFLVREADFMLNAIDSVSVLVLKP